MITDKQKLALPIAIRIANEQTDPTFVLQKLNGDIEIGTHDGGKYENVPLADAILTALEREENILYTVYCANATKIILMPNIMEAGARIHVDTDNEEWGRVASDATVIQVHATEVFATVESIKADIYIPTKDIVSLTLPKE